MSKGALFIISGPSGTGKGTVCHKLVEQGDVFLSVSATTRDIRLNEIDGITYHYLKKEQFETMIKQEEMLEWANYSGNYYGTPKAPIEKALSEGKNVILEIEPQGAFIVKEKMPEAVMIFVIPPSMKVLRERLIIRGRESDEQIQERILAAEWELRQAPKYNYIVVNDDLTRCVNEISCLMSNARDMKNKVYKLFEEIGKEV